MGMLTGKTAVITGSSRGLGLAIAEAYAREGAAVVIASRTAAAVEKAVRSLTDQGLHAAGLACDAADLEQVQALAELAVARFGWCSQTIGFACILHGRLELIGRGIWIQLRIRFFKQFVFAKTTPATRTLVARTTVACAWQSATWAGQLTS